jgi:hypothetical protein
MVSLALLPPFITLPIELYLRSYYCRGISAHHLGIIIETSLREALDFFGDKILPLSFAFATVAA